MTPGLVHEQRHRIGRAARLTLVGRSGPLLLALRPWSLDLDVTALEVRAELAQLVRVEVVLERERLELVLGDGSAVLDLVDEDADGCFDMRVQSCRSFPWVQSCRSFPWVVRRSPGPGARQHA